MTMKFVRPIEAFRFWFLEHGVSMDDLTVILNFKDAHAAVAFDAALRQDVEAYELTGTRPIDLREFEFMGVKIRVESPVHSS